MKFKTFVVQLLIFGLVSVYQSDVGLFPYPVEDFSTQRAFPVLKVFDVKTVEVQYEGVPVTVKLIGVNVPKAMPPQNLTESARNKAAAFTKNLLLGESVYLQFDKNRTDIYGNLQANLYRAPDGLFVNLEIVRQGYGHAVTLAPFKHAALFQHYESRARATEKGLWAVQTHRSANETRSRPSSKKQVRSVQTHRSANETVSQAQTKVYVTRTGKKYHRATCSSLRRSKIPIALEDAKRSYSPCLRCNP